MEILKTKNITNIQFQQIHVLWNKEFPVKLRDRFGVLLDGVENFNHYLVEENNEVIAWAVDFEKENETRFSIIVDQNYRGRGLGSLLIARLKNDLGTFYGWVIDHNNDLKEDGTYYQSPLLFYVRQGFEVIRDQRIDSELLKAVKIKSTP